MPGSAVMMFCTTVQTLPREIIISSCKLALTLPFSQMSSSLSLHPGLHQHLA